MLFIVFIFSVAVTAQFSAANITWILDSINGPFCRGEVGVQNVTWSTTLASAAQVSFYHKTWMCNSHVSRQAYADTRPSSHSCNPCNVYGENLFSATGYLAIQSIVEWTNEKLLWTCSQLPPAQVGHYSALVWNTTTSVGCGVSQSGASVWVVCRFSPAGNALNTRF